MQTADGATAPLNLVWGAEEIGKVIGRTPRVTFHLLTTGSLPAKKVGGRWVAERSKLVAFFSRASPLAPQDALRSRRSRVCKFADPRLC